MMASNVPGKKDLAVLTPGAPRTKVIGELGEPFLTGKTSQGSRDTFNFKQGYTRTNRVSRAVLHGLGDLFTTGLWELAATPMESSLQGEDVRVAVGYDDQQRVRNVEYYTGAWLAHGGPTTPSWLRFRNREQTARIGDWTTEPAVMQAGAEVTASPAADVRPELPESAFDESPVFNPSAVSTSATP